MKVKLTLALIATAISAAADTPRLIEALVRVESNGKANAVGDAGKAFGILQIHEITVKEANRLAQTRFTHADMMNPTGPDILVAVDAPLSCDPSSETYWSM